MSTEILNISLSTLIESSDLLGFQFDDRSKIRFAQNKYLIKSLQESTTKKLSNPNYSKYFTFGCMDFLVYNDEDKKKFYFIELNGTGMAGIANLPDFYFNQILNSIAQNIEFIQDDESPLILVPFSGTDNFKTSGSIKLVYERILYAHAIKEALKEEYGKSTITTLQKIQTNSGFKSDIPTVVLGYAKDIYEHIYSKNERLYMFNRAIAASLHDQFCCDLIENFKDKMDPDLFLPVNGINELAADKGASYDIYNDILHKRNYEYVDKKVFFKFAYNKEELYKEVLENVSSGNKIVIKPHSSGLGRGVEFFITQEPESAIIAKIDESLKCAEQFYSPSGNVYPYTISNYVDGAVIDKNDHPHKGHKFEIRIVVYRDNNELKAFPSLIKIASEKFDLSNINRYMLLNNVAASTGLKKAVSTSFSLPAANYKTLKLLGLNKSHLEELCLFSNNYIHEAVKKFHNSLNSDKTDKNNTSKIVNIDDVVNSKKAM